MHALEKSMNAAAMEFVPHSEYMEFAIPGDINHQALIPFAVS